MSHLLPAEIRNNPLRLQEIALSDTNAKKRKEATTLISDQDVLKQIAINDQVSMVQIEAIRKIEDQGFLIDIITQSNNSDIKKEALFQIGKTPSLYHLWKKKPKDWWVRRIIAEQLPLSSEDELVAIASEDENIYVRQAAINKIRNDSALFTVILKSYSKFPDNVKMVTRRMKDKELLLTLRLLVSGKEAKYIKNRLHQLR